MEGALPAERLSLAGEDYRLEDKETVTPHLPTGGHGGRTRDQGPGAQGWSHGRWGRRAEARRRSAPGARGRGQGPRSGARAGGEQARVLPLKGG